MFRAEVQSTLWGENGFAIQTLDRDSCIDCWRYLRAVFLPCLMIIIRCTEEPPSIMKKFDQCICTALSTQVKARLNLQGYLNAYRNCDNVWTLVLNNVEIKDGSGAMHVDKMKIVACEGKHSKSAPSQGSQKTGPNASRVSSGYSGPAQHVDADSGNVDEDRSDEDVP
ncbi:Transcription initiation factor IIA subunit 2 [Taenia crassiceps]|uniref:Transcription initiation factor IIA subunit 2 n=1 Tax=Taenia crassiceps TaxID=6207 RepID=A0ABR4QPZ4_9CEST